ncbi:2-hydroxychromene-2-carboxylate isomerase [Streptomyces blastmyceticus]|uniref:2-hydroxychromene-2-carboxylate isomerase n=1 Tax=Streptomyces blastmyceticus TaxID=68180 RepID=A0ABP3GAN3_9ACTN
MADRVTHPRPPRFYFGLRSPYSWFALLDLEEHHPGLADRLEWRPWWEPDEAGEQLLRGIGARFPYTPASPAKELYIQRDVRRLAAERGLEIVWPEDRSPWWEVPHLAWFVAEREGLGRAWAERISRARWLEGRDICDPRTVRRVAAELDLDPDEVAGAVDDPAVREQGARSLLDIHRDGVFGVPYFAHGLDTYWGVERLAAFAASLPDDTAGGQWAGPGTTGPADLGHAGGTG